MSKINWGAFEEASETTFARLEKGAFVCQIKAVHDNEQKQYIQVDFEITQGPSKGYFEENKNADGSWAYDGRLYRSYKAEHYGYLKRWVTVLEKSNSGYSFKQTQGDFAQWVGLKFIGVFADQEIPRAGDDGQPQVYVKLRDTRSIPAYEEGKIIVPQDVKKLNEYEQKKFLEETGTKYNGAEVEYEKGAETINEEDLPF